MYLLINFLKAAFILFIRGRVRNWR